MVSDLGDGILRRCHGQEQLLEIIDGMEMDLTGARYASFSAAGRELCIAQSAVSRQISALEESLGVSLFHRHARGLINVESFNKRLAGT